MITTKVSDSGGGLLDDRGDFVESEDCPVFAMLAVQTESRVVWRLSWHGGTVDDVLTKLYPAAVHCFTPRPLYTGTAKPCSSKILDASTARFPERQYTRMTQEEEDPSSQPAKSFGVDTWPVVLNIARESIKVAFGR